jgi:hypothetical protein
MAEHCTIHPDTELVVVTYCPACRGGQGGTNAAKGMTKAERSDRARTAVRARWAKAKKKTKKKRS